MFSSLVLHSLADGPFLALVEVIQRLHVLLVELEPVHGGIVLDPLGVVALGEGHPALLQAVSDQDVAALDAVLVCDAAQRRVVGLLVAHEGAVGLDDDAVLVAVLDDFALLSPGM